MSMYIIPQEKICSVHSKQTEVGANDETPFRLMGCPYCLIDWATKSFSDFLKSEGRTFEKPGETKPPVAPQCPNCASKSHRVRSRGTTAAGVDEFADAEGKRHYHDPNRITVEANCDICRKDFQYSPVNTCWCGWKSREDKS